MAKKFGKFLLFTAAVGTAAAAAYYYMQQKNSLLMESTDADDDYDDFHEDLDESTEFSRNYVPLKPKLPLPPLISHRSPVRQPICPAKKAKPSKMWKNFSMKRMPRTKSLP